MTRIAIPIVVAKEELNIKNVASSRTTLKTYAMLVK